MKYGKYGNFRGIEVEKGEFDIMKKILVMLMVGMLSVGMTACGRGNDDQQGSGQSTESQSQGNTESSAQQSGQATMEDAGNDAASQEQGANTDTSVGWSQEMQAVKQAVVDTIGENYWPNMQVTPDILESKYGITADMYEDYFAEEPMISANVDALVVIKAEEDTADAVEQALNAYRDNLVNDTMQYPMNIGKIQASRIERIGNYVCFVQLGADVTAASEVGEEEVIKQCQEQNELVITVIEQNVQHE